MATVSITTSPGYVLAAPLDPTSRTAWRVQVYPAETGGKHPVAHTIAEVVGRDVRQELGAAAQRLGWQRNGPAIFGEGSPPFYAWEAWPLPPVAVPAWAEDGPTEPAWGAADHESGDVHVTHSCAVGSAGGAVVAVTRTDSARAGMVTAGPLALSVSLAQDLDPAAAERLATLLQDAARRAAELAVIAQLAMGAEPDAQSR